MRTRISALILTLLFLFAALDAYAQPVTNIGPVTPGNLPQYNSPTVLKDSGIPASSIGGRLRPVGLQTYYVACDASGNDGNNGLTTATPWASLQHAWNYIVANLDLGLGSVQVNWQSNCTSNNGNVLTAYPQGFPFSTGVPITFQAGIFNGSGTTPTISATGVGANAGEAIHAAVNVRINFFGSFTMSSAGSDMVRSVFGASISFGASLSDNITCAGSFGVCLFAGEAGGVIGMNGTLHITGGGQAIIATQGGTFDAITVVSIDQPNLTFSDACFISGNQGILWASGASAASTFIGTGKASLICTRWKAREGGAIYAIGETTPDAYFPGNAAGSSQTTGFISSGALSSPQYGLGYGTAFTEAGGKDGGAFGNGTFGDQSAVLGMGGVAVGNCTLPSQGIRLCSNIPNLNGNGSGSIGSSAVPGAIIAGQGSTDDITFQNKNLVTVAHILTGTTNWVFSGTATFADAGTWGTGGIATSFAQFTGVGIGGSAPATGLRVSNNIPAVSGGTNQGALGTTAANGLQIAGNGSTDDIQLQNKNNAVVGHVPTGTQNFTWNGTVTFADGGAWSSGGIGSTVAIGVGGGAPSGGIRITSSQLGATGVNGLGAIGTTTAAGLELAGKGSTDDLELQNNANTVVCKIATGAINMDCVGSNGTSSAAAGFVGEFARTSANPGTALTSTVAADCATVSLTAGDWDVRGAVSYNPAGSTVINTLAAAINTTAATLPGNGDTNQTVQGPYNTTISDNSTVGVGPHRFLITSTTTMHLVGYARFTTSTMSFGPCTIEARRVR